MLFLPPPSPLKHKREALSEGDRQVLPGGLQEGDRWYHEESLQEKGELVARVLLALAEVVAVVQQVRVQPDLQTKAEGVFKTPTYQPPGALPVLHFKLHLVRPVHSLR